MPRQQPHEKHAQALWEAINAAPDDQRAYLVNFVTKNAHLPLPEMLARMEADLAGRVEAEKIQRHRDEKVMRDALDAAKRLGVEAIAGGVAAGSETTGVKG